MNISNSILVYITFSLWLISSALEAQNLVPNHSFEKAWTCPETFSTEATSSPFPGWFNPNKSTPDLFNVCSVVDAGIPMNFAGNIFPYEGVGYAGIILRETFDDSLSAAEGISREYLQSKLTSKLKRNRLYCVKFQYANSSKSLYAVNSLGATLTREQIKAKSFHQILQRPQIINKPSNMMNNTDEWIEMCGTYRARGNEQYITIGNFWSDKETRFERNNTAQTDSLFRYAYYYIDDVKVYEIEHTFECGCINDLSYGSDWLAENFDPETGYNSKSLDNKLLSTSMQTDTSINGSSGKISDSDENKNQNNETNKHLTNNELSNKKIESKELDNKNKEDFGLIKIKESEITKSAFENAKVGSKFNLNRIFFEFNSSELLSISFEELDRLSEILNSKPSLRIEIRGHSDIIGSPKYNKALSIKRAQAVYDYLIENKIDKSRMKYRGFGNSLPIADNETEKGRRQNRRVELVIVDL